MYQPDDVNIIGPASYYVTGARTWGVRVLQITSDSELFQTARTSSSSLRYYGVGLENGNYAVTLQFAEFAFEDSKTWTSLGRRVFDIYVQVGSSHAQPWFLSYELAMIIFLIFGAG